MDQTIIHVPSELFAPAESSSFSGTFGLATLEAGPDTYFFAEPLQWHVLVSNTGGALLVSGIVSGKGTTECARCLEPFEINIKGHVEAYFLLEGEEVRFEEGEEEEFDVLGPENTIDMAPLLQAAILIDLPLQPLCREDCRGICPDCGVNLNDESCDCAQKRAEADAVFIENQNPFAKLRDLKLE